jgi:hypothetical protein
MLFGQDIGDLFRLRCHGLHVNPSVAHFPDHALGQGSSAAYLHAGLR